MKKAFVAILSLAALVSCSQDSVVKTSDSTAISFDNMFVENKTRAAADPSTTTANIEEFAVWGFRGDAKDQELVFNNERVYKNEDGVWTYDHLQYWMEGKDYFFGAVSPVNRTDVITVNTENMSEDGLGTISFKNQKGDVDLLYAEKTVYASEINPSAPEKVSLQFAHLLSRVKFSFKYNFPNELTTVAVKNIKINNSPAEGYIDVTVARANWSWNIPQNGETTIIDFGHVENGNEFAEMDTYYESDEYRLVIPTDETRGHDITFDVVVYNNHKEAQTYSISTTLEDKAFVQGKSYNIVTEITPDNVVDGGLKPIVFDLIEVADWDSDIDVDLDGEQTEEPGDSEETTPGYKLYLENVEGWDNVYVYAWYAENTPVLGEWPGVEMTEKETIDEVEYFVYTLSSELNDKTISVIFNDGKGTQTADITGVELTKDNTFTNYVEPAKPTETKLYLQPNANWNIDNARFAAYLWGNGVSAVWYDMTLVEGETNIYEFTLPEGYDNIIFCRMNPNAAANDWNNKWNQTADLKVPTDGTNLYIVKEDTWDNGGGTWSTYTPAVVEPAEPVALATPKVVASVDVNVVTLTWDAVEGASYYTVQVDDDVEETVNATTYVFEGDYEVEYTFTVKAIAADTEKNTNSEAAVVTVTTEAEKTIEPEELIALDADCYYIFKPVTEIKGGKWYALVYDTKAATGLTGNYGYLKTTTALARTEGISLPATCAFGFLTTDGGFTIQQFDGKYVYQSGTYDSFNVAATASAGHVWSVGENGITNNATSKFVQYDPAYGTYGCYATAKGNIPAYYEMVEVDSTPMIVDLSASSLSFGQDAESKVVEVAIYGSATLSASASETWVSAEMSGNTITVSVEANEGEAREATVTINYGNDSRTVNVSQTAYVAPGTTVIYTDTLTSSMFKATSTTYTEFSGVQGTNGAVYAGKSAKSQNGYIQLRSNKSEDGIVTTASGGKVKKIVVEWDTANTSTGRTLDVYVRNTAYTKATELYNTSDTKAGSIVCGTSTELVISGDYEYVGLRSNSGAMYIKSIAITYEK